MMRAVSFHAGEWTEVDVDMRCLSLVNLKNGRVPASPGYLHKLGWSPRGVPFENRKDITVW